MILMDEDVEPQEQGVEEGTSRRAKILFDCKAMEQCMGGVKITGAKYVPEIHQLHVLVEGGQIPELPSPESGRLNAHIVMESDKYGELTLRNLEVHIPGTTAGYLKIPLRRPL